jgi:hypothetical protein
MPFLFSLVLLAISLTIMLLLGARYGRKPAYSFGGSVWRAILWSLVGSWSLVLLGGGHGVGVLPVPSIVALAISLFAAASNSSVLLESFPHVAISPLVPVAGYVLMASRKAEALSSGGLKM